LFITFVNVSLPAAAVSALGLRSVRVLTSSKLIISELVLVNPSVAFEQTSRIVTLVGLDLINVCVNS
jgi:hypothetical protein